MTGEKVVRLLVSRTMFCLQSHHPALPPPLSLLWVVMDTDPSTQITSSRTSLHSSHFTLTRSVKAGQTDPNKTVLALPPLHSVYPGLDSSKCLLISWPRAESGVQGVAGWRESGPSRERRRYPSGNSLEDCRSECYQVFSPDCRPGRGSRDTQLPQLLY